MTTEEKAAAFDLLTLALTNVFYDGRWSAWCISLVNQPYHPTRDECIPDLMAWAERVIADKKRQGKLWATNNPKETAVQTPEELKVHEPDYKPQAWEAYTLAELGWWVHLLATRAAHRATPDKRAKDIEDARNYLVMMDAKLKAIEARS
jgi:hypothetical protein